MYIEDLLIFLVKNVPINQFDQKILHSFYDQIIRGSSLTEKQGDLAVKILKRQKNKIESLLNCQISQFLENPAFNLGIRKINRQKILKIAGHDNFTRIIQAVFPYNEEIVLHIRENKPQLDFVNFNATEKIWEFPVNEKNLKFLMEFSIKFDFEVDETLSNYFEQISQVLKSFENYVPIVDITEDGYIFKNVPTVIKQPIGLNLLETCFLARKQGIHVWSDVVARQLKDSNVAPELEKFLNLPPNENLEIYLDKTSIFNIKDIVKHLLPALFIIPGGSETEKLQTSLELLKEIGIDNSQASVLFRLPNETHGEFNKFVKENGLNNSITEKIKVIFISSKIPKTIINPEIKFNSVINFNFYNVHYTIREFVKNHQNVIHIFENTPQKGIDFAQL